MKILSEERALELTELLLKNDKAIKDDLQQNMNNTISTEVTTQIEEQLQDSIQESVDKTVEESFPSATDEEIDGLFS